MSSDPKWWKERAKALKEGDTWPRTKKVQKVDEDDDEDDDEIISKPKNK